MNSNVINFLSSLSDQIEVRNELREKSKEDVLKYAWQKGFNFSEKDFDDTIWGFEMELAEQIKEKFDLSFSLWETMWGRYYLDYLIDNLIAVYSYTNKINP
jgi:hypothetical protein